MSEADLTLGCAEVVAKVLRQHNRTTKTPQGNCEAEAQVSPFFLSSCCFVYHARDVFLTCLSTKVKESSMISPVHRWQGWQVTSLKKKQLVTPHLTVFLASCFGFYLEYECPQGLQLSKVPAVSSAQKGVDGGFQSFQEERQRSRALADEEDFPGRHRRQKGRESVRNLHVLA